MGLVLKYAGSCVSLEYGSGSKMDRRPCFLIEKFPGISALGFYPVIIIQIFMAKNGGS
jgi:hypothetical protein